MVQGFSNRPTLKNTQVGSQSAVNASNMGKGIKTTGDTISGGTHFALRQCCNLIGAAICIGSVVPALILLMQATDNSLQIGETFRDDLKESMDRGQKYSKNANPLIAGVLSPLVAPAVGVKKAVEIGTTSRNEGASLSTTRSAESFVRGLVLGGRNLIEGSKDSGTESKTMNKIKLLAKDNPDRKDLQLLQEVLKLVKTIPNSSKWSSIRDIRETVGGTALTESTKALLSDVQRYLAADIFNHNTAAPTVVRKLTEAIAIRASFETGSEQS